MNTRYDRMQAPLFVAAIFIVAALITGCESNDQTIPESTLAVTPTAVTLDARTVSITEFAASGGVSNYAWSLSDNSLGTIYTTTGTTTIALYQNTKNIGTNTLTLTDIFHNNSVYATIWQK
jgi:hypothetical protein